MGEVKDMAKETSNVGFGMKIPRLHKVVPVFPMA